MDYYKGKLGKKLASEEKIKDLSKKLNSGVQNYLNLKRVVNSLNFELSWNYKKSNENSKWQIHLKGKGFSPKIGRGYTLNEAVENIIIMIHFTSNLLN